MVGKLRETTTIEGVRLKGKACVRSSELEGMGVS
jgi:hypothetical protein